jgi:purine-binding chemotaxis protein CheW
MSDITSQQLVVFSLGAEEYALPIGAVHEIIRFTEPRAVASEADWIRGVIGLRARSSRSSTSPPAWAWSS